MSGFDHGDGQNSFAIGRVGNRVEIVVALQLPVALVIAEEEQLVLDDRAADGRAELVALQAWALRKRRAEQKAGGVQIGVAEKLVSGAVKLVGSRFHDGVHHRAAHASVFGAVIAGDDFEFGDARPAMAAPPAPNSPGCWCRRRCCPGRPAGSCCKCCACRSR